MYSRALAIAALCAAPALADDKGWVGKTVILTEDGVQLVNGKKDADGNLVFVATLERLAYEVLDEDGDFIKVREDDTAGWFPKSKAVKSDEAIAYFTKVIAAAPEDASGYARRAVACMVEEKYDTAVDDCTYAMTLVPEKSWFLGLRARAHAAKEDYPQSIKDFDELIRLNPTLATAYYGRGTVRSSMKQYKRAIEDHNEAIRLDPKFYRAYGNRGFAYDSLKDYGRALKDYEEAARLNPKDPVSRNNIAWMRATCPDSKYRDGEKALALAREACELSAWKDPVSLGTFGAACAEAGRFDEAIKWQEKALEDARYRKQHGKSGAERLELYRAKKPFRDDKAEVPGA
jgi:tetratricopeptide (TPR) repeat protein